MKASPSLRSSVLPFSSHDNRRATKDGLLPLFLKSCPSTSPLRRYLQTQEASSVDNQANHLKRFSPGFHHQTSFFSSSSTRNWTYNETRRQSYRERLDTSTWKPRVNRKWTPMTVVMACVPILTFGLGTWQVQRLKWKRELIDDLEQKMRLEPIHLPRRINPNVIPEFEYRKVKVQGTFDHGKEILIQSRTRDAELGYHIITPFYREDGSDPILVNRGFIKREFKDPSSRPSSVTNDTVEVVGMLRKQEAKSFFQPGNSTNTNQWYFVDIQEIANHLGASPILIDAITSAHSGQLNEMLSKGLPIGRSPKISLRNMHATYIATWYGLSAITSVMAFTLLRKPMSGRSRFAGVQ